MSLLSEKSCQICWQKNPNKAKLNISTIHFSPTLIAWITPESLISPLMVKSDKGYHSWTKWGIWRCKAQCITFIVISNYTGLQILTQLIIEFSDLVINCPVGSSPANCLSQRTFKMSTKYLVWLSQGSSSGWKYLRNNRLPG